MHRHLVVCGIGLTLLQLSGCQAEEKATATSGTATQPASDQVVVEPPEVTAKLKAELDEERKEAQIANLRCSTAECNVALIPRFDALRVRLHEAVLKQLPDSGRRALVDEEAKWVIARDAAFAELPVVQDSPIAALNADQRIMFVNRRVDYLYKWLTEGRRPDKT
jgi:hypothetical protein